MSAAALRVVTDAEAEIIGLRAEALRRLRRRYPNPESCRAMEGSLRRLAQTFSAGQRTIDTFEWELLVDDDLAGQVWEAVAGTYSRATALKDASFLRQMLRCCCKVGLLTYEQSATARAVETGRGSPSTRPGMLLTPDDVNGLFEACWLDNASEAVAMRDVALLHTLASTGARRSETAAITTQNVHLDESRIWLTTTKNGTPRNAWLHRNSVEAVDAWRTALGDHRQALFPALSRTGRPLDDQPMSPHQIWKIVHRRADMAGLPGMTPHDLRRFVVSTLLDTTHDLALVARVVGHKNVNTTALYDRRPDARARAAIETLPLPKWHPIRCA